MQTPHTARQPWQWAGNRVPLGAIELAPGVTTDRGGTIVSRLLMAGVIRNGRYRDLIGGRVGAHTAIGVGKSPNGAAGWFDGTTSVITLPDEAAWDQTSLTALVGFTPRVVNTTQIIFGRWDDIGVDKRVWNLNMSSAGALRGDVGTSSGLFDANLRVTGPTLVAGRRYVAALLAGDGVSTLIVDGTSIATSSGSASNLLATDLAVEIGSNRFGGASRFFADGAIDFVFLWGNRLSTALLYRYTKNPNLLIQPMRTSMARKAGAAGVTAARARYMPLTGVA